MSLAERWVHGDAYEPYVGRWSRLVAADFIDWLAVPSGGNWLDVGCGTGALSQTVLLKAEPASVTGIDRSADIVAYAREHTKDSRARFGVGDAMAIPLADGLFSAVVSGLVLNFVPRYDVAVAEMARVAADGGTVAAYVWDYAGRMEMMRVFWDCAVDLDPAAAEKTEGSRFTICQPEPLADLFRGAGLADVEVRGIEVRTRFRDFDDYWTPFLSGQAPAPAYAMSLTEEQRTALREHIRSRLPVASDGSISLVARAWAVRGRK
ncbi:MAG TPA: class I SAM-dependent methyltransferase [Chloroflexia bacterium]|nr:class I SAM-dependent methyltransferase [Chloroflexia bacterium]